MGTTERQSLSGQEIKTRLRQRGITLRQFAREAGLGEGHLSAVLLGRDYCGPSRRARIENAILRLGIDRMDAQEPEALTPGEFRIRKL